MQAPNEPRVHHGILQPGPLHSEPQAPRGLPVPQDQAILATTGTRLHRAYNNHSAAAVPGVTVHQALRGQLLPDQPHLGPVRQEEDKWIMIYTNILVL